jgi:competence protein ComEC
MKVMQFPLSKITIGFVAGIVADYFFKPTTSMVFSILLLAIGTFLVCFIVSQKRNTSSVYFGLATYFLSFSIGACTLVMHTDSLHSSNYSNHKNLFEKPHLLRFIVREKLKSSPNYDRYSILLYQVNDSSINGKILWKVRKENQNLPSFEIGSRLQIEGILYRNGSIKNPNQFNYANYLETKKIYAQLYSDASKIQVATSLKKDIWYYSSQLRNKIIRNLEKKQFHKKELHVAIALILGQQHEIAPEIIQEYQYAGAIHILSVSGLHIGFILVFITYILKPFPNTKKGSLIKLVIILLSLSSFGLLAGLTPSVLRSVTMFSFVAIGIYLRRSTNIYHTLLVSMLVILVFEPFLLMDIGFQLSYLALFFILWLQPLLAQIWAPKNKIVHYFWEILTVSFAAQIGTLPLSLYYFHQFPGLFFVTNLVIIPFLSVIMGLGVLVMLLAALDIVPYFLTKSLEWSIYCLNKTIGSIASYEQFLFQDIPCNSVLVVGLYLVLLSVIIWCKKPNFNRLIFSLIAILVLQMLFFYTHWNLASQKEFIVFNTKKNSCIVERKGKNIHLYANDNVLKTAKQNKVLTSYLVGNFSRIKTQSRLQNLIYFNGNKILILDSLGVYTSGIRPDIVVITQSPKINLERFIHATQPKIVVADASNYQRLITLWEQTCIKEKTPFHATIEKGFYRLN